MRGCPGLIIAVLSFKVSGTYGSGKTHLIYHTIEEVKLDAEDASSHERYGGEKRFSNQMATQTPRPEENKEGSDDPPIKMSTRVS